MLHFALASASFASVPVGSGVALATQFPKRRFALVSPELTTERKGGEGGDGGGGEGGGRRDATLGECEISSGENLMVSPLAAEEEGSD